MVNYFFVSKFYFCCATGSWCSPPQTANEMKSVESIVKTYAWMKLTRTSSRSIKRENATETTVVVASTAAPNLAKMKIKSVNTMTIM